MRLIPVDQIHCDQEMNISRVDLTPDSCQELAQDIHTNGLIQPITVIPCARRQFQVAIGFRRWTAMAVILGWTEIPCEVQQWTPEEARLRNISENIQRKDLSYWEECRCLMSHFPPETSLTEIEVALNKSNTWARHRWLVGLPKQVINQVEAGLLGPTHIGVILAQKTRKEKIRAANKMISGEKRGETIRDMQRDLTGRKNQRAKKVVQQVMSLVLEQGAPTDQAAVHAMRYCIGEISDTLLYELLEKIRLDKP